MAPYLRGIIAITVVGLLSCCALNEVKFKGMTTSPLSPYADKENSIFGVEVHIAF